MGKAKKTKHQSRGHQPYNTSDSASQQGSARKTYFVDLLSLDDGKRFRAVKLLCSLYSVNASNKNMLEKIADAETLARLSMRLVDSYLPIRVEAIGALFNLTSGNVLEVVQRIVDAGIFRTITSLLAEVRIGAEACDDMTNMFVMRTLNCVSNLICNSEACLQELLRSTTILRQQVMEILMADSQALTMRQAAANLLMVASDANRPACEYLLQSGCCEALATVIRQSLYGAQSNSLDSCLLGLRSCGVLVNIFSSLYTQEDMFTRCCIGDILLRLSAFTQPDIELLTRYAQSKKKVKAPCLEDMEEEDIAMEAGEDTSAAADEAGLAETSREATEDALSAIKITASESAEVSPLEVIELASEILANICIVVREAEGDSEGDGDGDHSDDDDKMEDGEFDAANDAAAASASATGEIITYRSPTNSALQAIVDLVVKSNMLQTLSASAVAVMDVLVEIVKNVESQPLHQGFAELVQTLDRLLAASINATMIAGLVTRAVDPIVLENFLRVLEFLVNALLNTSRSADSDGSVRQPWPVDGYSESRSIPLMVIGAASTASNLITALSKVCNLPGSFIQRISLVLVQSISVPVLEVAMSNVESVGGIATLADYGPSICAVLTNCLLRRLAEPASYSVEGVPLEQCPVLLMDACINSLIDLHSGDDTDIFNVYVRMDTQTKIASALNNFQMKLQSCSLSKLNARKFKETLSNGRRFLKYKQQFKSLP